MKTVKALIGIAAIACSALALSQDYPARVITLVMPASAGGGGDAVARALAEEMGKRLKQSIVVDNKPGASGLLGASAVARAQPDGYTLLLAHPTPIYYAPYLIAKMPYDVKRDFALISEICSPILMIVVNKDVPARTMKEFVAWARAHKDKANYGSLGIGSYPHLTLAYLSETRQLGMTHIAYRGEAPMNQDMIAGQIQVGLGTLAALGPHIASGSLRPLAVISDKRLPDLPNVPTMAEAGFPDPQFKSVGGLALLAPAKTPAPILAMLEKEARASVQSTSLRARFQIYGFVPMGNSSAEFTKSLDASGPIIQKLVQVSGAKAE